jgi:hypothetical protein
MGFFRQSPDDLLVAAGEEALDRVKEKVDDRTMVVLESILRGAVSAARAAIEDVPALKALWGRGEGDKPRGLLEVAALAMLSRWLAIWENKYAFASMPAGTSQLPRVVLEMFGDASEERLERFRQLDIQYRHDRAKQPFSLEAELRCREAREALGDEMPGEWPSAGFPFNDTYDLFRSYPDFAVADWDDSFALQNRLAMGWQATAAWYRDAVARGRPAW